MIASNWKSTMTVEQCYRCTPARNYFMYTIVIKTDQSFCKLWNFAWSNEVQTTPRTGSAFQTAVVSHNNIHLRRAFWQEMLQVNSVNMIRRLYWASICHACGLRMRTVQEGVKTMISFPHYIMPACRYDLWGRYTRHVWKIHVSWPDQRTL